MGGEHREFAGWTWATGRVRCVTRPFRFGIQLHNAPSAATWRENARKAEDLGFSTLFLPDHFGESWSPTVPLAMAAAATTTLKVGALVFDNDYRHPLVLARDMAALDLLSEGRVEFGIGAGWMTTDYEQSGIPLDKPGVRIDRMAEAIDVIRELWTQDSVTKNGTYYQLNSAKCHPRPFTPGGPPMIIGGGGKRVLSIAAQHAAIIGVNPELTSGTAGVEAAKTAVADRYLERISWIRDAAGSRFADIELQILCQFEKVHPDREKYASEIAPFFDVAPEEALQMPIVLVGTVDQICDDLINRREKFGFSYVVVHDMDAFAPVVDRLAGK